jgi:hypothetical protein
MVIPRHDVESLLAAFEMDLSTKVNGSSATDLLNWKHWNEDAERISKEGKKGEIGGGFISCPLLVDHSPGWSSTWNRQRKDIWMGHRDFWNFKSR